jgi:hypothetical protein
MEDKLHNLPFLMTWTKDENIAVSKSIHFPQAESMYTLLLSKKLPCIEMHATLVKRILKDFEMNLP